MRLNRLWLLLFTACRCDELESKAKELGPILELSAPNAVERSSALVSDLINLCTSRKKQPGGSGLTNAGEVFCRQIAHVTRYDPPDDCSLDVLGWTKRGYLDQFNEQVHAGECSGYIRPSNEMQKACHGKHMPLDAFQACGSQVIEIPFREILTLTSLWISARSTSTRAYRLEFRGKSTTWYKAEDGEALNLTFKSGWHTLPAITARKVYLHGGAGKHCVCLAFRGCGRSHRYSSPSFRQIFMEGYPIFGMQYLLQDLPSKSRVPRAPARPRSPCDFRVEAMVKRLSLQLLAPAARLIPWHQLVDVDPPEDLENCSTLMRAKWEAAKVLLKSPHLLDLRGGDVAVDELQLRDALMQVDHSEHHLRSADPDLCLGSMELWQFLHRAQLRLMQRADVPLHGIYAFDVAQLMAGGDRCAVPYTGQFGADHWVLEEVFCCKRDGVYVDIGAAHSWKLSNTYAMDVFLDWQGICFDAIFEDPEGFQHTRSCQQVQQPVWSVAGETRSFLRPRGQRAFGHGWVVGDNSTAEQQKTEQMTLDLGSDWDFEKRTLLTTTLADVLLPFLSSRSLTAVDFLSLDIEGHEDLILESFFAAQPAVLIRSMAIEVNGGDAKADRIQRIMEQQGYVLDRRTDVRGNGDEFWRHGSVEA